MGRVTSFDVAELAGVSQSTVSRALRGDTRIGAATMRRVHAAAAELGYVPSERARDLSVGSTRRIAMVVDLDNPLWSLLVERLYDLIEQRGYRLTLVAGHGDAAALEAALLGGGVDGVILAPVDLRSNVPAALRSRGVPAVTLQRYTETAELDAAVADDFAGGESAARLLLSAGHRRFGAVLGPADASTSRDRAAGFRSVLNREGIELPARLVRSGSFGHATGDRGTTELLGLGEELDAVFCGNDSIAIGAINAARRLGLSVPGDLAIVGFDDLQEAAWPVFELTTVRVPFDDMLHSAVTMLMERIEGWSGAARRVVHPVAPVPRRTHLG